MAGEATATALLAAARRAKFRREIVMYFLPGRTVATLSRQFVFDDCRQFSPYAA
jgi:hypothetical protein